MKDLTVIIPLHEYDDTIGNSLMNAIESVKTQVNDDKETSIIIVAKKDIVSLIKNKTNKVKGIDILSNDGETDFCSQINIGAANCKTKYFSILEFDDAYAPKWFKNAAQYLACDPSINICLPLNEYRNSENGELISFGNEMVWASAFSNELGVIDSECLETKYDFNMTGAIFDTNDFIEIGGLKPSIKVAFWYEFLLRAAYKGLKIYVVPKFGYMHILNREGSLMAQYTATIDANEGIAWYNLAKREYPFKEDRKKVPNMELENNEINELK